MGRRSCYGPYIVREWVIFDSRSRSGVRPYVTLSFISFTGVGDGQYPMKWTRMSVGYDTIWTNWSISLLNLGYNTGGIISTCIPYTVTTLLYRSFITSSLLYVSFFTNLCLCELETREYWEVFPEVCECSVSLMSSKWMLQWSWNTGGFVPSSDFSCICFVLLF